MTWELPRRPGIPDSAAPGIVAAFKSGENIEAIAKRIGFGATTVWRLLRKHGCASAREGAASKLPTGRNAEIAEKRRAGATLAQLAAEYGVSVRTIEERVRSEGVEAFEGLGKDAEKYAEMHAAGMTLSAIGREMGVTHHTVAKWLERRGVRAPHARGPAQGDTAVRLGRALSGAERAEMVRLYAAANGVESIARTMHCSPTTVARILRQCGVALRPQGAEGVTPSGRARISRAHKGKRRPAQWRQRIADGIARAQTRGKMQARSSKPETVVAEVLAGLGIAFARQVPVAISSRTGKRSTRYLYADFLVEGLGVIEVFGGYWHCDPRIYPQGPVTEVQRIHCARDARKAKDYESAGHRMAILWEMDIKNNPDAAVKAALLELHRKALLGR